MTTDDRDDFAAQIREAVLDCLIAEVVIERLRETEDEIRISLPIDVFFEMHDDD